MELELNNTAWVEGKHFVLTGGFTDEERETISTTILSLGGIYDHGTQPDTDYIIWQERIYGSTKKLKKAKEFNGHGSSITIYTQDEFIRRLAGEEITPSTTQSTARFGNIADYMAKKDPAYVETWLSSHEINTPLAQEILYELLRAYNRVTFRAQRQWVDRIASTGMLQFRLYDMAIRYYTRIAEYDAAEAVCDLAVRCMNPDDPYSSDRDKVEDLRVDIDYYRANPFWPATKALRRELEEIYDAKGIEHPPVEPPVKEKPVRTAKPKTVKKTIKVVNTDGTETEETVEVVEEAEPRPARPSNKGHRDDGRTFEKLKEDRIEELRAAIDALDYSDNSDNKYNGLVDVNGFYVSHIGPATMDQFVDAGWISCWGDLFRLKNRREEMVQSGLFTEAKVDRMLQAIENAREITDIKFLQALRIPMLSEENVLKLLQKYTVKQLIEVGERHHDLYQLAEEAGIGAATSVSILSWFENEENVSMLQDLMKEVTIREASKEASGGRCTGVTFVVTGDVYKFKNRDALKSYIRSQGGEHKDSVTKATCYLINNDLNSTSSKNKKAHQLNIPIISEDEFIEKFGGVD